MDQRTDGGRGVYIVFGGAGGIGTSVCRQLGSSGSHVVVAGRDPSRAADLANEIGGEAWSVEATAWDDVEGCVKDVMDRHGRVDGIVNCVGSLLLKPAHATKQDEWEQTIASNLGSAFSVVRAAGRTLRRTGGSVVLVSSAAAQVGLANHEAIAAAKAGIKGLVRSAAATYAGSGIRVNAVAPGMVRTPATEELLANEKAEAASIYLHALGRLGEPDDVASAICWLLSPLQSWVTGQVIGVDGGLSGIRPR